MSYGSSEFDRPSEQTQQLHVHWVRQAEALMQKEQEALALCDDLRSYAEIMKGATINTFDGPVAFDQLPALKESVISGLKEALRVLTEIEQQTVTQVHGRDVGISLRTQKDRLQNVIRQLQSVDVTEIYTDSHRMADDVRNQFASFVRMSPHSNQMKDLVRQSTVIDAMTIGYTLDSHELARAVKNIHARHDDIFQPVRAFDQFSEALFNARAVAKKKQAEELKPVLERLNQIVQEAVVADRLTNDQRSRSNGVAKPVDELHRRTRIIQEGGQHDFWTSDKYRTFIERPFDDARDFAREYPAAKRTIDEERAAASRPAPVTAEQTKKAGGSSATVSLLGRLFGYK